MIARLLVMAMAVMVAGCSSPRPPSPPPSPAPVDRVELGRRLFSDARLSADGHTSCATCHDPKRAFTDGLPVAHGRNGPLQRNTPTLLNLEARAPYFWDGRARTLEEQALVPITNPQEMGRSLDDLVRLLSSLPEYTAAFGAEGITPDTIARALAAYERTLVSGRSRYDRYLFGERDALTFEELKGLEVFEGKGECTTC
ncbi:MAG TPA: cytochrome-c peroxidase, partial [Myxococcaceae bacterium]|nr:cytochrome-c peroxidase [Myxococcaceae bacterium]